MTTLTLIDEVFELINNNTSNKQLNKIIFKYLVQNNCNYEIIETGCNFNLTELNNKQLLDIKILLASQENSLFTVDFEL
jgi:hypothetical protein